MSKDLLNIVNPATWGKLFEASKDVGWVPNLFKAEASSWKQLFGTPTWFDNLFKEPPLKDKLTKTADYAAGMTPALAQKGAIKGAEYTLFIVNKTKATLTGTMSATAKAPVMGFKALKGRAFSALKLAKTILTLGMAR